MDDLAAQTTIEYGVVRNSHNQRFFETSRIPIFAKMWAFMRSRNSLVDNVTEGVERAMKGSYAFIGDSIILDYYATKKPCNTLTTVGGLVECQLLPSYKHTNIQTYVHYTPIHIHASNIYIHTYIHTYIHKYIHTHTCI